MKRRTFMQASATTALSSLIGCRSHYQSNQGFDVEVVNDFFKGHHLLKPPPKGETATLKTDLFIVGGGVAGLTAAFRSKSRDFMLCDLGQSLGGSSGFGSFGDLKFAQGAHYELEEPENYGEDVLHLMAELKIIGLNPIRQLWEFFDRQYLIDPQRESKCFSAGGYSDEVLPDTEETQLFHRILAQFENQMQQPTRLIAKELHFLNDLSMSQYLRDCGLPLSPDFQRSLDYHMKDDYGAGSDHVSALAGIHYYRCRPYYLKTVQVFSPPQGNGYFVEKLAHALPQEALLSSHLVMGIEEKDKGFSIDVLDLNQMSYKNILANQVIYAGQKHALPRIFPKDADLFKSNRYAPWLVLNFILKGSAFKDAFWQNEILGEDHRLLGFVNSMAQDQQASHHVLTTYFCLNESERKLLLFEQGDERYWIDLALTEINSYLQRDITPMLEKVFVKLHGHAMPIPYPGYLFQDANNKRSNPNLVYAGVDNGRLPLVFEAMDSGIQAAKLLKTI